MATTSLANPPGRMGGEPARHVGRPLYRAVQGAFWAACILLAPVLISAWFTLCPEYGDPTCPDEHLPLAALAAFRAASPALLQAFEWINLLAPYLYPLGYIGLGVLAMKRAPWLAMFGIACGWLGGVPWGVISDQNLLLGDMAHMGSDAVFADLLTRYFAHWEITLIAGGWVLGHLLGYLLLGIALWRARVVPAWAAWLIVLAAPVMGPLAYATHQGSLQVLGFLLVFVGSLPAAVATIREHVGSLQEQHAA